MYEITNRQRGAIQLVVRSKTELNSFVTLSIPGVGSGKNVYLLEDEQMTEYVKKADRKKEITAKYVTETVTEGV